MTDGGTARQFPCSQCGANLTFTPGTTHLTCPYCGHVEEVPVEAGEIQEHDLEATLASAPKTRGWGTETRAIRCENCGATIPKPRLQAIPYAMRCVDCARKQEGDRV